MLTTKDLLVEHLVKWQYEIGENKSQAEFAKYIGENEKYLSMLMNGRKASKRQTRQFAEFFKDPRFYDAAGMERPIPLNLFIIKTLPLAPEDHRRRIAEELSPYTTEPIPNGEADQRDKT